MNGEAQRAAQILFLVFVTLAAPLLIAFHPSKTLLWPLISLLIDGMCLAGIFFLFSRQKRLRSVPEGDSTAEPFKKKLRLWLASIYLICAAIYLGDFFINGSHPFSEFGAAVSLLLFSTVIIVSVVREK